MIFHALTKPMLPDHQITHHHCLPRQIKNPLGCYLDFPTRISHLSALYHSFLLINAITPHRHHNTLLLDYHPTLPLRCCTILSLSCHPTLLLSYLPFSQHHVKVVKSQPPLETTLFMQQINKSSFVPVNTVINNNGDLVGTDK